MRRFTLLVGLIVIVGLPALAQDYPRAEIFGAFSYLHVDPVVAPREIAFGWQASVSGNFHKNLGLVADFAGQYKSVTVDTERAKFQAYEYLFGPRFFVRGERATGFVHALFGAATARASILGVTITESAFALGFGGGADVNVNDRVAVRVLQFDYIPVRESGVWSHNLRLGFGIVIKAGGGS